VNKRLWLQYFSIIAMLVTLNGCASFDKNEMVVMDYNLRHTHPYSLSVDVGVGDEKSDVGLMPIPRQDFQYAIRESIRNGHIFERVVTGKGGDYLLNVTVFSLEQPVMGFTMTVKLEAGWTLKKTGGDVVWQKLIKSKYTLGVSDAFVGQTRLRIANDGAIRENIKQGTLELSSLNL